jgi:hypothetical protein
VVATSTSASRDETRHRILKLVGQLMAMRHHDSRFEHAVVHEEDLSLAT